MEDALKRLDKLTQDEARMAAAETLRLTRVVDNKMTTLINSTSCKLGTLGPDNERRLDGKETKQVVQQLANSMDDVKCL